MTTIMRASSFVVTFGCVLLLGCRSLPGPLETTDDGLERVVSRAAGGVYRAPGATFTQYQEIMLEPLVVSFAKDWERNHPNARPGEVKRIREEAQALFREEFTRELIKRGKYRYAEAPGPNVLMISPSVIDLDIVPEITDADVKTLAPAPPSMQIVSELRDAATGTLVGRIIMFSGGDHYAFNGLRPVNRVTNAYEQRLAYGKYVLLVREALNIAKTERPRAPKPPPRPE
jgi:hypothetical protein